MIVVNLAKYLKQTLYKSVLLVPDNIKKAGRIPSRETQPAY